MDEEETQASIDIQRGAEAILDVLQGQAFADWYAPPGEVYCPQGGLAGRFEAFITCETDAPSRTVILDDIKQMFRQALTAAHKPTREGRCRIPD